MVFGLEKNYDDKIQNILNHARILAVSPPEELIILEPPAELDPVLQISSELETDIPLFFSSIRVLISLFITSTSFRILLSNLLLLTRQYFLSSLVKGVRKVEDIAVKVENAADTAQNLADNAVHVADQVHDAAEGLDLGAAGIEDVAKDAEHVALNLDFSSTSVPEAREEVVDELRGLKTRAEDVAEHTLGEVRQVQSTRHEHAREQRDAQEPHTTRKQRELDVDRAEAEANQAEEWKDAIVDSVQKILLQIHQNPAQISALRTLFSLSRKWINHYRNIRSLSSSDSESGLGFDIPDTPQWKHLKALLRDSKDLVERLAGERSLDPLLHAFEDVVTLPLPARVSHPPSSLSRSSSSDSLGKGKQTNLVEDLEDEEEENNFDESQLLSDLVASFNGIASSSLGTGFEPKSESEQVEYIISDSFHEDVGVLVEKVRRVRKEAEAPSVSSIATPNLTDPASDASSNESQPTSTPTPKLVHFQNEFSAFLSSFCADRTSRRLLRSLNVLAQDIQRYISPSSDEDGNLDKRQQRSTSGPSMFNSSSSPGVSALTTMLNDIVGFIIPKLVGGFIESLFGKNAIPQTTVDYGSSAEAEEVTTRKEWCFPLPLPRVELVSNTSESSSHSTDSGSDSRWLEGVLDPRLMRIRVLDDKEVQFGQEANANTVAMSCFSWCCCCNTDPYVDAEAGYATYITRPERGREGEGAWAQTDMASLLTPSSIAITQWSETRVEFYSSVPPAFAPAVTVDAEPLLVDVDVPGEEGHHNLPCLHLSASQAPLNSLEFDSDSDGSDSLDGLQDNQDDHLLAVVEDGRRGLEGAVKTAVKTTNRMHLHVEGVLSSLPSLPIPNTLDSATTPGPYSTVSAKSKITQRLTLENIGYYARYNLLSSVFGTWLGVGDEGLLDLEFEFQDIKSSTATTSSNKADGAELDMDIEVDASTDIDSLLHLKEEESNELDSEPFKISNTRFTLPHTLNITPRLRTLPNHTLLSKLTSVPRKVLLAFLLRPVVLPLAQIVVRRELESAIGQGIEHASEVVCRTLVRTVKAARLRARERAMGIKKEAEALAKRRGEAVDDQSRVAVQVGFGDVWDSLVETLGEVSSDEEDAEADAEPEVEVHTSVKEVGLKGVQLERTAAVEDDNRSSGGVGSGGGEEEVTSATTTTVAIGLAPQLLPDRADLLSSALPSTDSPAEVADRVVSETQTAVLTAVDDAVEGVKDTLKQGVEDVQGRSAKRCRSR
ncbi:hypothetical protein BT96DRAFT_989363 [Gymnopus androsaceus JB14]|uniref:HAM1-like N-terminal domain-containing protein n=1 Tax=Gymnopus androsaceus JB14 TaxID=1447944 RepID=A0A6A4I6U5_9AGAR|nr:hypothetical protein BT96DRAFT_989363 [Gymnopus androsaceus JB14]